MSPQNVPATAPDTPHIDRVVAVIYDPARFAWRARCEVCDRLLAEVSLEHARRAGKLAVPHVIRHRCTVLDEP